MIQEHDLVALREDVPAEKLASGDVGTVVGIYRNGEAYEVEFMTIGGETVAVTTLPARLLRPVSPNEMHQSRPLVAA